MNPSPSLVQRQPAWLNWLFALFMALMLAATLAPSKAQAAPAAGTSIGNQAAATYTDASLVSRNVTSNTVSTIVTFVMVFIIQASTNRSDKAIQLKLDALIAHLQDVPSEIVGAEALTEHRVEELASLVKHRVEAEEPPQGTTSA